MFTATSKYKACDNKILKTLQSLNIFNYQELLAAVVEGAEPFLHPEKEAVRESILLLPISESRWLSSRPRLLVGVVDAVVDDDKRMTAEKNE